MNPAVVSGEDTEKPLSMEPSSSGPDIGRLQSIIHGYRPDMGPYEDFYRQVHQDPEISGMESNTAAIVVKHLKQLGFEVHSGIGGHGVAAVFKNGPGKTILMRAELDALPILEKTDVSYRSTKRMMDRYGNERPVMHACGHDMNMATLLGASALLMAAAEKWSGTLVIVFQPDEEETRGAQAMVDDGLYSKVPIPDIMLGQHLVPSRSGTVAIRSGPVLVAADSGNIRVIGGPCPGVNPQHCVDPIPVTVDILSRLQDDVRREVGPDEVATVACWGFHAGIPGNDYVAYADFMLDVKTVKPAIREQVHQVIRRTIQDACKAANTPEEPVINFTVRAPLTSNDPSVTEPINQVFQGYFQTDVVEMKFTPACEDFSTLGAEHSVPYAYWNFGGSQVTEGPVPSNHSPFFAPAIQPTLRVGIDAMAIAALTFLVT
jgi:amidohydrolase